ncbi:MAG: hypothetical protein QOI07_892 [Verrucomicrobiota bacterium]|jgi:hypothetical protein
MNEQTTKLIEELAQKLGTTAEHLWSVLVRQAPISASVDFIQLIGLWALSYFLIRYAVKKWRDCDIEGEDCEGRVMMATIASGIVFVMAMIAFFTAPGNIVSGFFNPEYWALKQIIK